MFFEIAQSFNHTCRYIASLDTPRMGYTVFCIYLIILFFNFFATYETDEKLRIYPREQEHFCIKIDNSFLYLCFGIFIKEVKSFCNDQKQLFVYFSVIDHLADQFIYVEKEKNKTGFTQVWEIVNYLYLCQDIKVPSSC